MSTALLSHRYDERAPVERLCRHLWRLGPRAITEFLNEIADDHGIAIEIQRKLENYRRIDHDTLAAVGGSGFAHPPMYAIAMWSGR